MEAHERLIGYRNRYINQADEKINQEYLSLIDSVLDEWNFIKSKVEKIEEQHKRFIKYFGVNNSFCIDMILKMNNIVYSFFDRIVDTYNLNSTQIHELIHTIYYWEAKADAILSEYKFYTLIQYFYIVNYNEVINNEEFMKWNEDKKQFSIQHKYRIEFCMTTDDYYSHCTTFLGHLRAKYFSYIDNKYKQLCQTTKY